MKINWLTAITAAFSTGLGTALASGVLSPTSKYTGISVIILGTIQAFQQSLLKPNPLPQQLPLALTPSKL